MLEELGKQHPAPGQLLDAFRATFDGLSGFIRSHHIVTIPSDVRPKHFSPHPTMTTDEIRIGTQKVWDDFYSMSAVWARSSCVKSIKGRLAFVFVSKLYRQMYANTGIATDSARRKSATRWARMLAGPCRRLFSAKPMPELQMPHFAPADRSLVTSIGSA